MTGWKGEGCKILENEEDREACKKITTGAHSYRSWKDVDFGHLFEQCRKDAENQQERLDCTVTVRKGLQWVEDGRFNDAMKKLHRFFMPLDKDERITFTKRNRNIVKRMNEWAHVQKTAKVDDLIKEVK